MTAVTAPDLQQLAKSAWGSKARMDASKRCEAAQRLGPSLPPVCRIRQQAELERVGAHHPGRVGHSPISGPLAQLLQGTSECLAAREHGLEQVAVLFDPLERLAHPEAARRHVLC
jgi:hypothetical protein